MIRPRKRHHLYISAVAGMLTLLFLAACVGYRNQSPDLLPPLTAQLGTVAMAQGSRAEAAGDFESALARYARALAGNFSGAQDRVHVEKRMGVILWKQGEYETAIPHLERAQDTPLPSLNGYRPLVECLVATGERDRAEVVAQTWFDGSVEDGPSRADAHQALGRLALARNDSAVARAHFDAAIALVPEHEALVDLAALCHEVGATEEGVEHLTNYLASAAPGEGAEKAWTLLDAWEGENRGTR